MRSADRTTLPLTAYYDGSCRLCASEMHNLHGLDAAGVLRLVDCSPADFDDLDCRRDSVTRDALMAAMHVRDAAGAWFTGVDAFEALYGAVGVPAMARAWTHPLLRPINERLYPSVVRHRHRLSALGLHHAVNAVTRVAARRRAESARCRPADTCRTPTSVDL